MPVRAARPGPRSVAEPNPGCGRLRGNGPQPRAYADILGSRHGIRLRGLAADTLVDSAADDPPQRKAGLSPIPASAAAIQATIIAQRV